MNANENKKPIQFVTALQPIAHQVGDHLMAALARPEAVAVITTVVPGIASDRVISMPLTKKQLQGVQEILSSIKNDAQQQETAQEDTPCIGFHCVINRRNEAKESNSQ